MGAEITLRSLPWPLTSQPDSLTTEDLLLSLNPSLSTITTITTTILLIPPAFQIILTTCIFVYLITT
ncbi:hypothetical protein E2C01_064911 [Portunus trituberculatus]|uniref:Uncharacterized protein n=1 Tax=Portunus trituberculatus TaxID=210409 RepID=A0A5B7HL45_PORTR|nr:hypothetical protein [Portunus trituberculatus]